MKYKNNPREFKTPPHIQELPHDIPNRHELHDVISMLMEKRVPYAKLIPKFENGTYIINNYFCFINLGVICPYKILYNYICIYNQKFIYVNF